MIFNDDFREFILALNASQVEFILIGGYSVMLYGYPRTTGDLDIWLNRTPENYKKLIRAFSEFGLPTNAISIEDFLHNESMDVYSFGRSPVAIDLLVKVKGLDFDLALANSVIMQPDGFPVRVVSYHDLIKLKKAAGRNKDFDDLAHIKNPNES
ncbi:MAG: nucleotidyltransferase [Chitinophagales bacterium]